MGRLGGRPSHKSEPRRKRLGALQRMDQANPSLVHRLAYNSDVVAFKMGRRSGLGRTVRAGLAVRGRISKSIRNRSGGSRTAAGPFSTQPPSAAASSLVFL